jgi:hypothetical protein
VRDAATEAGLYADARRLSAQIGGASPWTAENERCEDGLWIEVSTDPRGFKAFYQERGRASELVSADDRDGLLEYMMADVAFGLAGRTELANRRPGEDSRRQMFSVQETLMDRLDPRWGDNLRRRHADILARHPYLDRP